MGWYNEVRWIHILAGTAWFGAVVLINVAIVPALKDLERSQRAAVLTAVFPRIFRFASFASVIALGAGFFLFYLRFRANWSAVWSEPHGIAFLIGGTLAIGLTLFHFVLEPKLADACSFTEREIDDERLNSVTQQLRTIPRGGLFVITGIIVFMMYGARGL